MLRSGFEIILKTRLIIQIYRVLGLLCIDLSNFNAFQKNSYALEELKFSVASSEQKLNKEAINPFN